jgi:tRNA modification GTPase
MQKTDVIAAISTAPGRGGIAVVRISGPDLAPFMRELVGRRLLARRAVLSDFFGTKREVIDRGIALYFPAPHSYTGEDVLELQGHGGMVVMRLLLQRCLELGARIAEPGEFTRRAYLNDKIDLAQAEAVADLIDASTAQAARSALRSLRGAFSALITDLVRELTELRALVEAVLDFPEEEIDFLQQAEAEGRIARLRQQLQAVLVASRRGKLLREGIHVALAGRPNVGKSSLLNRLAGEDLAIVTEVPGTTRDAIRLSVDVRGVPVHFIDTAGLRESGDAVEQIGITRAWSAIEAADAILLVMDASVGETESDHRILSRLPAGVPCIRVMNKIDLTPETPRVVVELSTTIVWMSALTGAGTDQLLDAILAECGWQGESEGLFLARERHVVALETARKHFDRAIGLSGQLELFAEELRLAQVALGTITGQRSADELLGEIFARFCIGK